MLVARALADNVISAFCGGFTAMIGSMIALVSVRMMGGATAPESLDGLVGVGVAAACWPALGCCAVCGAIESVDGAFDVCSAAKLAIEFKDAKPMRAVKNAAISKDSTIVRPSLK